MFDLPKEYNEAVKNTANTANTGLPCPYPAPLLYWHHGDASLSSVKEIADPRRFGGWAIDKKMLGDIEGLPPELPKSWQLFEGLVSKSTGDPYDAYMTRHVWAAKVARRWRWNTFNNRGEVQYLCYFAEFVDKKVVPWGLVILTAKSFDTKVLDKIFSDFDAKTANLRGDTRSSFFFVPIGTFGDAPKLEARVGKGGKSSQVTPMQLHVPAKGYEIDLLKTIFVGQEIAKEIADAAANPALKLWLDEWNAKKAEAAPVEPEAPPDNPFDPA